MPTTRTAPSAAGFQSLGLSESLLAAVAALGYEEATPVQRATIPLILGGSDVLAQAATGTGKTAAFALPMIQRLLEPVLGESESASPGESAKERAQRAAGIHEERPRLIGRPKKPSKGTSSLVLVPTRELAMQVSEAIHKYAGGTGVTVVPLYGGASMDQQTRALERGAQIVVATPGRVLDHIRRKTLALDAVRLLVLDEADEMLDMGFADDIESILKETPASRQTALFSATLPSRILKIAERHLKSPKRLTIADEKTKSGALPRVRQVAYIVRRDQKPAALDRILDMEQPGSAIVFCRTRLEVDTLVEMLNAHAYKAEALHGGMMQRQRDAVMNRVRSGKTDLLIATDVAARGLDIDRLTHVVNFDLPTDAQSYVHRIGRTGRAGRTGTAITLADPREHHLLRTIERTTKQTIEVATIPTIADLRARRLEQTANTLRARLSANDFDDVRAVVTGLSADFDIVDIAAAAVKMAHLATTSESDERDIEDLRRPTGAARPGTTGRPTSAPRPGSPTRRGTGPLVRVFFGAGKASGVRPGDLVGAIAGEAGIEASSIGPIQVKETYSIAEVPEAQADDIIAVVRASGIRGRKVVVRRDRNV